MESLYIIPFGPLLTRLNKAGYEISVEHILEIQTYFLSVPLTDIKIRELKYIITPLIAKTPNDQDKIYAIVDGFIDEKIQSPGHQPGTKKNTGPAIPDTPGGGNKKTRKILWWLLVFVAVVSLLYIKYALGDPHITPGPVPDSPAISSIHDSGGSTFPLHKKLDTSNKQRSDDLPVLPVIPTKIDSVLIITSSGPIERESITSNVNLQLSVIFGILIGVVLSYFLFSVKEIGYGYGKDGTLDDYFKNDDTNAYKKENSSSKDKKLESTGLNLLPRFNNNEYLLKESKTFHLLKRNLKRLKTGSRFMLDVPKSVYATAQNAGYFTTCLTYQKEKYKFLILLDEQNVSGHLNNLMNYLIKKLGDEKITIEKYSFKTNMSYVTGSKGNIISLKELAAIRSDFSLLIFSDAKGLFQNFAPNPQIINILNKWESRSIITPIPILDWSYNEGILLQKKFNVVPSDIRAIELLTVVLSSSAKLDQPSIIKKISTPYSASGYDFEDINDLADYMDDPALFQWLCSLSIYPMLDWNITIALYNAVVKQNARTGVSALTNDYDTLLKIARIPWLHFENMDNSLRLALFNALEKETEHTARLTLLNVIQEAKANIEKDSPAFKQLKAQQLLNEFLLYVHDKKLYKRFAYSQKFILAVIDELKEWAFDKHIDSGKNKLMPENKTGSHMSIKQFLIRQEEVRKTKISFWRAAVICIPPILIYSFITSFKPSFAYRTSHKDQIENTDIRLIFHTEPCATRNKNFIYLNGPGIDTGFAIPQADVSTRVSNNDTFILKNRKHDVPVQLHYKISGRSFPETIGCTDSIYHISLNPCNISRALD